MIKAALRSFLILMCATMMIEVSVNEAKAVPLSIGTGFQEFFFGGAGSDWDRVFDFTLTGNAVLTVTDGYLQGDVFEVSNISGGTSVLGLTSLPVGSDSDNIGDDYDAAALDARWSTGIFNLSAGSYSISGSVSSSPFDGGAGALRLDLLNSNPDGDGFPTNSVPEPSSLILLSSALCGVGLRKKIKKNL